MSAQAIVEAMLSVCEARANCSVNGEFWRRLAGSLRKALTLL